jgi:uncharacterized repeat protein (TIGR03843 family)
VTLDGVTSACVHKPVAGERPLWDFPEGTLAGREVAAYLVSEASGWGVVPPTVLRDGPFGPGMCQLWIEHTDEELVDVVPQGCVPAGWLPVVDALGTGGMEVTLVHADHPALRRMALLDVMTNNADRKGGHILPLPDGTVHGVDHGLCFNVEDKPRTVLWGWAGEPLAEEERVTLERLDAELGGRLAAVLRPLVSRVEVDATRHRIRRLLRRGRMPRPGGGWPAIPWPPF